MERKFSIEEETDDYILLRDVANKPLVQQDAQEVVAWLHQAGYVTDENKQVIYIQSDDEPIELYHDGNGNFEGFGFTQLD